jgi:hypothetical protein
MKLQKILDQEGQDGVYPGSQKKEFYEFQKIMEGKSLGLTP